MQEVSRDSALTEWIRGIAQRFRNPLNALQLHLDSLRTEIASCPIDNPTVVFDQLERIQKNLAEMDSFVCGVLRLTDLACPQTASVDVNSLVKEVEMFSRLESSKKDLNVETHLDKSLPRIEADATQIKQAVLNLLLNAIQFSPPKSRITLATQANEAHILIAVKDNGDGIPPAHRERIFDPFFSTKEGALGLGLSLALEVVRTHGGDISVRAEAGKGSEFSVSLPINKGKR